MLLPNDQSNLQIDLKPNEFRYIITKQLFLQLTEPMQSKIVFQVIFNKISTKYFSIYVFLFFIVYKN